MSHFSVIVLVEPQEAASTLSIEHVVGRLLAPYDEELKVPLYEKPCYCIGLTARQEAAKQMEEEMGDWDEFRNAFWANHPVGFLKSSGDEATEDQMNIAWREESAPRKARQQELEQKHPLYNKPDPMCGRWSAADIKHHCPKNVKPGDIYDDFFQEDGSTEGCLGTGVMKSTYNPKTKWDWWQIGGRWTGLLDGYEPTKDPKNTMVCELCGGTGDRPGWVMYYDPEKHSVVPITKTGQPPAPGHERRFNDDWAEKCNGCNGCHGTGKTIRWPTTWVEHPGDVMPICVVIAKGKDLNEIVPHAVVTPDGEWHESGEMGWFGVVHDEKERDAWNKEAQTLFERHANCLAVVVDCHI